MVGNMVTYYTTRGCSVVDYCVVSESLYDKIINFELPTFTDHCPLYMALEVNCDNCTENEQQKEIHALYRHCIGTSKYKRGFWKI